MTGEGGGGRFHGRVAYDRGYGGLFVDDTGSERTARVSSDSSRRTIGAASPASVSAATCFSARF